MSSVIWRWLALSGMSDPRLWSTAGRTLRASGAVRIRSKDLLLDAPRKECLICSEHGSLRGHSKTFATSHGLDKAIAPGHSRRRPGYVPDSELNLSHSCISRGSLKPFTRPYGSLSVPGAPIAGFVTSRIVVSVVRQFAG